LAKLQTASFLRFAKLSAPLPASLPNSVESHSASTLLFNPMELTKK
jgi:hypothetical protein